jgi:hypothetical protein
MLTYSLGAHRARNPKEHAMHNLKLALIITAALSLGACSTVETAAVSSSIPVIGAIVGSTSAGASANATLAKLSGGNFAVACGTVEVAEGYFDTKFPQLAPGNQNVGSQSETGIDTLCNNPPSNITAAMADLSALWTQIQAATTVTK